MAATTIIIITIIVLEKYYDNDKRNVAVYNYSIAFVIQKQSEKSLSVSNYSPIPWFKKWTSANLLLTLNTRTTNNIHRSVAWQNLYIIYNIKNGDVIILIITNGYGVPNKQTNKQIQYIYTHNTKWRWERSFN